MTARAVWTLCAYADVHAALRDDRLAPYGVHTRRDASHRVVRAAVQQELPPTLLARWRETLGARAVERLATLPSEGAVDLMQDMAQPWAHEAARQVLGIPPQVVATCLPLAATLFEESARAKSGSPSVALSQAATKLAGLLEGYGGAGTVQSFVALTHTVPALSGGAMLALLQHPAQLEWLRAHAGEQALAVATNELLRFAGPSRAVFRTALAPMVLGGHAIDTDDEVVLLLSEANRDPLVFSNPERLDVQRVESGHLAFGAGAHGCVGAGIVRMLLHEAIAAFVRSPREFDLDASDGGSVKWLDGFAMRPLRAIPTIVRERRASSV
ncbi:cytochrome P450 [Gemmatimonas groenlandica]|uniref:Cytochrome P450 n=1 Tax=Gemmatimonas groenlandica TaxID=2732249 RepID=A0A6M4IQU9_9BACT|nr:cytochrome P450 [Gemmatimonas groenlandica]QJR35776.1 cytochrome P450 [Gemmatimonas groenlandica]